MSTNLFHRLHWFAVLAFAAGFGSFSRRRRQLVFNVDESSFGRRRRVVVTFDVLVFEFVVAKTSQTVSLYLVLLLLVLLLVFLFLFVVLVLVVDVAAAACDVEVRRRRRRRYDATAGSQRFEKIRRVRDLVHRQT